MENKELLLYIEKIAGKDSRRITVAVSSEAIDRDDEIVTTAAMKAAMPKFMENPVVLAANKHHFPDGTSSVIGKVVRWWQQGVKTYCEIEFSDTPLGNQYQLLYSNKYQRAFSIRFDSLKKSHQNIDCKSRVIHTEIKLYKISSAAIPANPKALSQSINCHVDFIQQKHNNIGFCGKDSQEHQALQEKLTFDEILVCRHLEKQGIGFAEVLFSL